MSLLDKFKKKGYESEKDDRVVAAVKAAIHKAKTCKNPLQNTILF